MGASTSQQNMARPAAHLGLVRGWNAARDAFNDGAFNIRPYQGDMVANLDPMQMMAYNRAPNLVASAQGNINAGEVAARRAMDPRARSAAWGQVRDNVIADIMPSINSSFAGSGRVGSGLHMQNLAKGLSAGLAGAEVDAWQQGENRALAAAGMMPGLANARMDANNYLTGMGGMVQGQNQREIEANALRDYQQQTMRRDAITDFLTLMSGTSAPFTTQTQQQNPGVGGILSMGLQALPFL